MGKPPLVQTFGVNVREQRRARGWSQEELAEVSGLDRSYISHVECGRRNPTLSIVAQLALALEVDPSVLLIKRQDN